MDSLLFLSARRVFTQRPLPTLPPHLYPVVFQVAFLDRRPLVLRDLVAAWPFKELNLQQLVGHRELQRNPCKLCIEAVIQGVVAQLRQELEEPGRHSSLRMLDMTGLSHSGLPSNTHAESTVWFPTDALADACMEVSKHQAEFQRRGPKRHKGLSGAAMAVAAPQPPGVDIHTDLSVDRVSYRNVRDGLQVGAAGLLRLKCREFEAHKISALWIMTLLESLDPSCLRRVELVFNSLGWTDLLVILPQLSRFPELRSLKLEDDNMKDRRLMPESAVSIRWVARYLRMLPGLRELKLVSTQFSGNLCQILCDLQAPLESLEFTFCNLVPDDLIFLSQSFHAPALKRLDLSEDELYEGLLEPLLLLLEKTSSSLLYLNLGDSYMTDSDLHALLPTLQRCSRLRFLGLYSKSLSTAALKDLLQKTVELPDLHQVVYPIPEDCYKPEPPDSVLNLVVDKERLAAAKAEFSQILENSGRMNLVWTDSPDDHRDLDYFSL